MVTPIGQTLKDSMSPIEPFDLTAWILQFHSSFARLCRVLVAWFRLKYPHVAIGAMASSDPILYFDNIIPQDCFYTVETSGNCYTIICSSWGDNDKIAAPLEFLKLLFTEIAQYNPSKPNKDYIKAACDAIVSEAKSASGDLLDGIYSRVVTALGE
ncbi:hypothetical protein Cgig2_009319 [Carnegiea gigantea]|uniref:Uncharacterized protein n=1 Tax=Carnegiea gigantea TaxID=171969 RepID=A0A9Q1Q936_9CARY|nr:hypothetical protein Cgig2_009319 [Carnegiea gigantea]